jgi:hypothetical protein
MSTLKLIGLGIAWMLAAFAIAVVVAILATELLDVIGVVESGEASYSFAINAILLVVFAGLVMVPFIFRGRFIDPETDDLGE